MVFIIFSLHFADGQYFQQHTDYFLQSGEEPFLAMSMQTSSRRYIGHSQAWRFDCPMTDRIGALVRSQLLQGGGASHWLLAWPTPSR